MGKWEYEPRVQKGFYDGSIPKQKRMASKELAIPNPPTKQQAWERKPFHFGPCAEKFCIGLDTRLLDGVPYCRGHFYEHYVTP